MSVQSSWNLNIAAEMVLTKIDPAGCIKICGADFLILVVNRIPKSRQPSDLILKRRFQVQIVDINAVGKSNAHLSINFCRKKPLSFLPRLLPPFFIMF